MRETIFDFRINLLDSDLMKLISASQAVCIDFDFRVVEVVKRRDFSIKSQARFSNGNAPEFTEVEEYCSGEVKCLAQTYYNGVFEYVNMFNLSPDEAPVIPSVLIRSSEFLGMFEMRGFDENGFYFLNTSVLVRGNVFPDLFIFLPFTMARLPLLQDTMYLSTENINIKYLHSEVEKSAIDTGFTSLIHNYLYHRIISLEGGSLNLISYSEKNTALRDELHHLLVYSVSVFDTSLNDMSTKGWSISVTIGDLTDLVDMTFDYGIILHLTKDTDATYSETMRLTTIL